MSVAPPLFSHVPAALFGPLAGSHAPLYWSMLSTFYHHEFEREPFFLIRQIEDEGRIQATLRFARGLGLQLVMATPKERSELVAPWVETSLYIHRDAVSGIPAVMDFTKEFKPDANPGNGGPPGPAVPAA